MAPFQQQQSLSPQLQQQLQCHRCNSAKADTSQATDLDSAIFDSDEPSLRRLAPTPDRLLPGEWLLHVGTTADGGAAALTNYRLLLLSHCGRLSACLLAGALERPAVIADAPSDALNGVAETGSLATTPAAAATDAEVSAASGSSAQNAAESRGAPRPGRRETSRLLLVSRVSRATLRLGFPRPGDAATWADRLDPAGALAATCHRAGIGTAIRRQRSGDDKQEAEEDLLGGYAAELSEPEFQAEQSRLGLTSSASAAQSDDAESSPAQWRQAESPPGLCPSYPRLHTLPAGVSDTDLALSAKYRANGRFPSVVWRCAANGAVLARSAQPLVGLAGLLGWRCEADEKLVRLLTSRPDCKVLVTDARPYSAALGNGTMGGGYERPEYYTGTEIEYLGLPNLHAVRNSFAAVRSLLGAAAPPEPAATACPGAAPAAPRQFAFGPAELDGTGWLQLVSGLLTGASRIARVLAAEGRSVLVHCSDGWDRTPQLTCLCLLMCDPYYRTLRGFRLLVTREWLDFGHKFADRCGNATAGDKLSAASSYNGSSSSERSPIFLQFLDCAHQLLAQFPQEFEFTQLLLRRLALHCHSGLFPALAANSVAERTARRLSEHSLCPWRLLRLRGVLNRRFQPQQQRVIPATDVASLRFWSELYTPAPDPGLDWDRLDWDGLPAECDWDQADGKDLADQLSELSTSKQQQQLRSSCRPEDSRKDSALPHPPPSPPPPPPTSDGRIAVQS